jgi:hypothetical protein
MPQCRALKTFKGRYGLLRSGQIFSSEKGYADALRQKNMVVILPDDPQPSRIQAFERAPLTQHAGPPAQNPPPPVAPDTADPKADGKEKPSASSHPAPASRRKTSSHHGRASAP